jgi:hypothetical protein
MTWQPGQSGNPAGRKPGDGHKTKLVQQFWRAAQRQWQEKGAEYLEKFADADPGGFCRMIAMLMPREEITKAVSHQIEVTLKTPSWLQHQPDEQSEGQYDSGALQSLPYTPVLDIEADSDS